MPSPALSAAAAKLTAMTSSPLGRAKAPAAPPSSASRPNSFSASPASAGSFPDVLSQQMGLTDQLSSAFGALGGGATGLPGAGSDPLSALMGNAGGPTSGLSSALASPALAKALAGAQQNLSSAVSNAGGALSSVGTALSGAAGTKAKNAIAWAKSMLGRQDWNNLCERFVEEAYGTRGVFPTAKDAGKQLVTHRGSSSLKSAPAGALLYFAADDTNDQAGHAAIYLGDGQMISARPGGVEIERVDSAYNKARYVGWSAPPTKFPGRKSTSTPRPASAISSAAPNGSSRPPLTTSLVPRSEPTFGSSPATPGLAAVPPALRQPPRSASSPR